MNDDIMINGKLLTSFGGITQLDYVIGGTPIDNQVFQGMNRTTWTLLKSRFGLREITLTIVFSGRTLREAKINKSRFDLEIHGKAEIYIPDDGFYYSTVCTALGDDELIGQNVPIAQIVDPRTLIAKIKATYKLEGIRHDPLVTETIPAGGVLTCPSTMPFTDCRLKATVGASADLYTLGGAVFSGVAAGDVLTFDGLDGTITKNGQSYAANVSWVHFPALTPGENVIPCVDPVIVAFYPTYI